MPTIAELQINLDARPVEQGTSALNDFATAAERAAKAGKGFHDTTSGNGGGLAPEPETRKVKDLSEAIDAQTRKLNTLAEQRRKLTASDMKSTAPAEYERLNNIIDANITKVMQQGNAIDQVNTKRGNAFLTAEKQANAEIKAQERVTNAAITQENVVSRVAASQQRQIDNTINGLSRQIKAQNEYNATIEKLNRARALGTNGSMGSDGGISGAEYDSYVKLAQAKRDASYATEDNSRALAASQSKLDTYTASLSRADRAEVQYARAVRVLNENLNNGNISQEQYNQKLERFTAHRDKAIAGAESNAAAEAKLEKQLNQVVSAYDPVLRAQQNYENSVRILKTGLDNGSISQAQFNKALGEQREALDAVKASQSSFATIGSDYDNALRAVLPYRTELGNLEKQQRALEDAKKAGFVQTPQQIKDYDEATSAIKRQTEEYKKRIKEGQNAGITFKQEQAAMRGLPAQFTDIVVSLQGGQAPLTVLLQQGGQIKDMFGGIGPAIRAMGTGLMNMINPVTLVSAGLVALGAAAYTGSSELTDFNKAMIQSAGASGVSASQFAQFRDNLDNTTTTATKAAEALTQIASGGKIAGDMFTKVAESAILMERATGTSMDKTIADFNALGKDPVDAAVRLDEKYHFLTASVLAQADALVKQGQETEAVKLLQGELSEAATTMANRMIEEAGYIEKAWHGVKQIVSETWDQMKNIGRQGTTTDELAELMRQRQNIADQVDLVNMIPEAVRPANTDQKNKLAEIDREIAQKKLRIGMEQYSAEQEAATEKRRRESVVSESASQKRYEAGLKGVEKAENDLKKVRLENEKIKAGGNVSSEQSARMLANEAKAIKDVEEAKKKRDKPKPPGALDTTSIQEVKSNLAMIEAEYDGHFKKITSLGDAGLVSAEATYHSQRSILEAEKNAVSKSYDEQISAIKNLQGNKKNSAAQNISLENQLSKAEAARAVSMEKIDTKMAELQNKENGRIAERTRNIAAYKAALDNQLEGLVEQGARNADGVGQGSRQAAVTKELGQLDRSFAKQQTGLAAALGRGDMDVVEYTEKLKDLEETHSKMTAQVIANDKDIQKANYDWTNGYTSAVADAQDAGMNFAGTVGSALTGAFNSAGEALSEFVTTGKLSFSDFASSVLKDMARIASQQAANATLGALFNIAGAAFMGASAPTSAGSTQAGYNNLSGWTGPAQAKGGAWSGGTQLFAQGGAFTNSVVSQPTAFGMSNGAKGIMGEAGEEAIIPLARTRNGDLGVRMMGSGGGSGGATIVNIDVQVTESGSSAKSDGGAGWNQFSSELAGFVETGVYKVINKETRPGGSLQAQGGR